MSDNSDDKDNKWMPIATILAAGITGLLTGGLGLKFYDSWVKAVPVIVQNWVIKIPPNR